MTEPLESSIRVLVVDDDTTFLEIAREFLEQVPGFVVDVEQSSSEGAPWLLSPIDTTRSFPTIGCLDWMASGS